VGVEGLVLAAPSGLVVGFLPKLLVLTCSCLACPLVGVGPYG